MNTIFGYNVYNKGSGNLINEFKNVIHRGEIATIFALNTQKLYQGNKNENLNKIFNSFTYTIPDGQSIAFAEKIINGNNIDTISGAELMIDLIRISSTNNYRIFFLGSTQELLDKVSRKVNAEFPSLSSIVAYQHGYYSFDEEDQIIKNIASFKPDILFVAFGSPQKEIFIQNNKDRLNSRIIMGVGGSYEVFVGDKKLDPFTKRIGLRWLMRTLQDPFRLAPRYAVCNTYFLYLLSKELIKRRVLKNNSK